MMFECDESMKMNIKTIAGMQKYAFTILSFQTMILHLVFGIISIKNPVWIVKFCTLFLKVKGREQKSP